MRTQDSSSEAQFHEEFVALFARHQRRVFAYIGTLLANTADAEEVMQETSIILWRKWNEFDASRDFVRWANGIAYREVLRYLREKKSPKVQFSEALMARVASEYEQQMVQQDARQEALTRCLAKLSEKERHLVQQRYQNNSSVKQIAGVVGRPAKSIYRSLERIRERLLECVQRVVAAGEHG